MLRAALTSIVLASAALAACGSSSSNGPAVVAGAAAGDVTEVSGTVTATRDGKPRPLAVGDVVSGDDLIETGADGRVRITLRHNQVAWNLGPGSKEQVGASLAWKAPKAVQTAAGPTGERSGAAGRHAEREAADTAASGEMAKAEEAAPAAAMAPAPVAAADMPAPGAAPTPPPPPLPDPPTEREAAAARDEHAPHMARGAKMAKEAPDDTAVFEATLDAEGANEKGGGGLGLSGTGAGGGGSGSGVGLGSIGTLGHGSGTGEGRGFGAGTQTAVKGSVKVTAVSGGLPLEVATRVVRTRQTLMLQCFKTTKATSTITLLVGTDGKVKKVETSSKLDGTIRACLNSRLTDMTFPIVNPETKIGVIVDARGI